MWQNALVPTSRIAARAAVTGRSHVMRVDAACDVPITQLEDAAHLAGGHALGLAFPEHEADVAALMRRGVPLLPIGAQSSVTGGGTPMGELLVSTAKLDRIVEIGDGFVRAEAGVPLDRLEPALNAAGWTYPPVPTWTAATVGGVVSTNAAGPGTFKHGVTRDWVLAITVVLPSGDVLDLRRGEVVADADRGLRIDTSARELALRIPDLPLPEVPKRSAGYHCCAGMDLIDLFIGAEGTLGIVCEVTLRTLPHHASTARALVPAPTEAAAIEFVRALRHASHSTWRRREPQGIDVSAIEHLDRRSLELLREDGVDRREQLTWPDAAGVVLFVDLDLPAALTPADGMEPDGDGPRRGRPRQPAGTVLPARGGARSARRHRGGPARRRAAPREHDRRS